MIVTPLGYGFIALFAVLSVNGRSSFVWAIAVSMFFQDSAMVVVGGIGVAPFSASLVVALVMQVVFLIRRSTADRRFRGPVGPLAADSPRGRWMRWALLVLVVYGIASSAIGPWLFNGVLVMPSQGSSDYLVDDLPKLVYSLSNVAQIAYLILNAVLVWFIATLPRVPKSAFFTAICVAMALVLVAVVLSVLHVPWPYDLFDNSPRNYYSSPVDDPRLRAQFSEPSHLALFLTMTLAYAVRLLAMPGTRRRILAVGLIVVGSVAFALNPSTTIILALAVLGPAAVVVLAIRSRRVLFSRRGVIGIAVGVAVAGVGLALLWQPIWSFLGPQLFGKVGSSSQYSRAKQDLNALSLFGQSFGAGVGLGSNRSSSLAAMLLSDIGIIGTVAYYAVIVLAATILFRRSASPEGWALTALAVACAISVADFVSPPTWFLIGIAAHLSRPAAPYGAAHRSPLTRRRLPQLLGVSR